MTGISRSSRLAKGSDCLHRYLKPGALARLRDSRISAMSHKPTSITRFITHRVDSLPSSHVSVVDLDQVPCLKSKIYGPRCFNRNKLVATRSVVFLNLGPSVPVLGHGGGELMTL